MSVQGWTPEKDVEKTVTLAPIKLESHESWLPSEHPLHRPRHARRQFTALLSAAVFFVVPVLTLAMGARPAEFENHRLAAFPSPLDGWGFFTGLSDWATDHLPFRDAAIRAADGVSRGVFGEAAPFDKNEAPPQAPFAPPPPVQPPGDTLELGEEEPPISAGFPKVIEGKDGWLYYGFDVQGKCKPTRPLDQTIASLVRLRRAVEASGRRFVLVVPPDKSTAVPQNLPSSYAGKSCAAPATDEFWRRITTEVGATDLRDGLRRIVELGGPPPYYKLDTHWDDRGALLMVRRIADKLEPGVSADWKIEPERTSNFAADLPKLMGRGGDNLVQMYSLAPDGGRDRTRAAADLRTPLRIKSSATGGMVTDSVAMLTDSFSIAATRYLPATFTDIDVVFYSTWSSDPNQVLDILVDSDVVVIEAVERNLTSGIASVVDPATVDRISQKLAENPRN